MATIDISVRCRCQNFFKKKGRHTRTIPRKWRRRKPKIHFQGPIGMIGGTAQWPTHVCGFGFDTTGPHKRVAPVVNMPMTEAMTRGWAKPPGFTITLGRATLLGGRMFTASPKKKIKLRRPLGAKLLLWEGRTNNPLLLKAITYNTFILFVLLGLLNFILKNWCAMFSGRSSMVKMVIYKNRINVI